jgi:hypothetical protein
MFVKMSVLVLDAVFMLPSSSLAVTTAFHAILNSCCNRLLLKFIPSTKIFESSGTDKCLLSLIAFSPFTTPVL